MNKIFTFSFLAIALVTAGLYFAKQNAALNSNQDVMMGEEKMMEGEKEDKMMSDDGIMEGEKEDKMMGDSTMMADHGSYIDYSQQNFENNKDKKRILFFYAAWCPTCRPADANFKANLDELPSDTVLFRVNYDTEKDLKQKYNITYQHTYVQVDENGNEVAKWNGGQIEQLLSNIK